MESLLFPKAAPSSAKALPSGKKSEGRDLISSSSSSSSSSFEIPSFLGSLSVWKLGWERVQAPLSVLSSLQFVLQTYVTRSGWPRWRQADEAMEAVLAALFGLDGVLNLVMARFSSSPPPLHCLVDLVTAASVFLTLGDAGRGGGLGVLHLLRALKAVRLIRLLRLSPWLAEAVSDPVQRQVAEMALQATAMLLFFAALLQSLEEAEQEESLHVWLYFAWVTVATVGYGDVLPLTWAGRLAAMALIACALINLPRMTQQLLDQMKLQSVHVRAVFQPPSRSSPHVVVCGDVSSLALHAFFQELFHEDHGEPDLHAVLLLPHPPSLPLLLLLRHPRYRHNLCYLQGSALARRDLARARVQSAKAVFVLADQFSSRPDDCDAQSILVNLSLRRYLASYPRSQKTLFCTQLIRSENRRHLSRWWRGGAGEGRAKEVQEVQEEVVVCLDEVKMGALAKALLYPGANTLIMNLLSSTSERDSQQQQQQPAGQINGKHWTREYSEGVQWEIYCTSLSSAFANYSFARLSLALYQQSGALLFGLQTAEGEVVLNPLDYRISPQGEQQVFVIARDQSMAQMLATPSSSSCYCEEEVGEEKLPCSSSSCYPEDTTPPPPPPPPAAPATSLEEQVYEMKDKQFSQTFYTRTSPADLHDVTIQTSLQEEAEEVEGHLLLLLRGGKRDLFDLIRPLRARHLPLQHIVLLCPEEVSPAAWRRIACFDRLLLLRGSSLEQKDLQRAGVFRAAQVVVLADDRSSMADDESVESDGTLADSDAIFASQLVRRMNPSAQLLVELVHESNIRYLEEEEGGGDSPQHFRFTAAFASGMLFTTSLTDSLVSQTFFNPHIVRVLDKLLAGPQSYVTTQTPAERQRASNSCLYQIAMPDSSEVKTYGQLFEALAERGILPLGLLRGTFAHLSLGPRSNRTNYVVTNPSPSTELFSCDRIFVLSPWPVRSHRQECWTFADWLDDVERQRHCAAGSSPPSDFQQDSSSRNLVHHLQRLQRDLRDKLAEISHLLGEAVEKQEMLCETEEEQEEESTQDLPSPSPRAGSAGASLAMRSFSQEGCLEEEEVVVGGI